MFVLANLIAAIAQVLDYLLWAYVWILFGRVVVSWVNADPSNPIVVRDLPAEITASGNHNIYLHAPFIAWRQASCPSCGRDLLWIALLAGCPAGGLNAVHHASHHHAATGWRQCRHR